MTKNKKFSDLVTELLDVWIQWMRYNNICKDESVSIKQRKEAADVCEQLIDRRYEIIDLMDAFFPSSGSN